MSSDGLTRISACFQRLKRTGRGGLGAYIVAGDPTLRKTGSILTALAAGGVDLIEIGYPFSDPVGEGADIQAAHLRSLRNGTTLKGVIKMVASVRPSIGDIPVVLMGYVNPVLALGAAETVALAAEATIDGFIIVDQPLEEAEGCGSACKKDPLSGVIGVQQGPLISIV